MSRQNDELAWSSNCLRAQVDQWWSWMVRWVCFNLITDWWLIKRVSPWLPSQCPARLRPRASSRPAVRGSQSSGRRLGQRNPVRLLRTNGEPHVTGKDKLTCDIQVWAFLLLCRLQVGPKGKVIGIDHIKELVDDSISNVKKDDPSLITSGRVKLIGEQWQAVCVC